MNVKDWTLSEVKEMNPPLTGPALLVGSRAYGTPREDSDIDLVVYTTEKVEDFFAKYKLDPKDTQSAELYPGTVCRFGILNLIITSDVVFYNIWVEGLKIIETLRKKAPISRDEAKNIFKMLRKASGIPVYEEPTT